VTKQSEVNPAKQLNGYSFSQIRSKYPNFELNSNYFETSDSEFCYLVLSTAGLLPFLTSPSLAIFFVTNQRNRPSAGRKPNNTRTKETSAREISPGSDALRFPGGKVPF
jgi:hypothetical protein